jgi:hypothetical protein
LYSCVIVGRIDVGQEHSRRSEAFEFRAVDLRHAQRAAEIAGGEASGVDRRPDAITATAAITREQGLHAARRPDPGAVGVAAAMHQFLQQALVQKWEITRDHEYVLAGGPVDRGVDATDRPEIREAIGIDRHRHIREACGFRRDDEQLVCHPLQDVDLSNDDGIAADDETALVETAKAAGLATGQNGCGRRGAAHGTIMTEARIGRLVAAALHGAIAERLPQRLDFYETWLTSDGMRDGTIGLAPLSAVIGFLRTEGAAYDLVTARAGELAAVWSVASLSPASRHAIGWLPRPLRARAALRVAAAIIRHVQSTSRASMRMRRNRVRVEVVSSLFCSVREAGHLPLCAFYVALAVEVLRQFTIRAVGRAERCRAIEGGTCLVTLELTGAESAEPPAIAA